MIMMKRQQSLQRIVFCLFVLLLHSCVLDVLLLSSSSSSSLSNNKMMIGIVDSFTTITTLQHHHLHLHHQHQHQHHYQHQPNHHNENRIPHRHHDRISIITHIKCHGRHSTIQRNNMLNNNDDSTRNDDDDDDSKEIRPDANDDIADDENITTSIIEDEEPVPKLDPNMLAYVYFGNKYFYYGSIVIADICLEKRKTLFQNKTVKELLEPLTSKDEVTDLCSDAGIDTRKGLSCWEEIKGTTATGLLPAFKTPDDLNRFLLKKITLFVPDITQTAANTKFSDKCLEFCLGDRRTKFLPNNEDNIKILLAVSGAGKTRLLLELLYERYGYYFVARNGAIGSGDLEACRQKAEENPTKVEYYIELLYFIRAFICNYLIQLGYKEPSDILLAQLRPKEFFGVDLFKILFEALAPYDRLVFRFEYMKNKFDFAVIDEIQLTITGQELFAGTIKLRPFFSPLARYSKTAANIKTFILAGTGINFSLLKELVESAVFKDISTNYELLSPLHPLSWDEVKDYCRYILRQNRTEEEIKEFLAAIEHVPECQGRARFIAYILDKFIDNPGLGADYAINEFISILSNVNSPLFPLRFYVDDKEYGLSKVIGQKDTVHRLLSEAAMSYMINSSSEINLSSDDAAKAVLYGIGFCEIVDRRAITSVKLTELAVMYCLRYVIPCNDIMVRLCSEMDRYPNPQMVGYMLDYIVAFGLVGYLNKNALESVKISADPVARFVERLEQNVLIFPEHLCGPDIMYKDNDIIYLVQVKFVDKISKQARLQACETTDHNKFYLNKTSGRTLKGFEEKHNNIIAAFEGKQCKRFVFLHTTTKTTEGMDSVTVINQDAYSDFFNNLNHGMWTYLNSLRAKFNSAVKNKSS